MGTLFPTAAQTAATVPVVLINRFCYRVGKHTLLLESAVSTEVLTGQAIYPLPFTPDWCGGLTSVRGDLLPVVDMHRILQQPLIPRQRQMLLVKHEQLPPVVLTCDGYPRLLKLPDSGLDTRHTGNFPAWITGAMQHEGQWLLEADHGRLLRQIKRLSAPAS